MSLSQAQLTALATDINAQASLASARTAKDAALVCAFYNAASATAIWRADIRSSEVVAVVAQSEFVALTAIKQNGLLFMMQPGTLDASSANVRNGFASIFAAGATLTALTALAQRTATRIEALFGTGGPPVVSPLYGYSLQAVDVQQAMGW